MTFLSAFILGIVASAHCAGMCGGLQMAMQSGGSQSIALRSNKEALVHIFLLNIGRVITYIFAGLFFSSLGYTLLSQMNVSEYAQWLRMITGTLILLIGLQLLLVRQRLFQFVEPIGVALWRSVSKYINHTSGLKKQSLISGMAWGFLPCGLVYSVLVTTVFSNDIPSTGMVMLGFGLGTTPSLILTGFLFKRFRNVVSHYSFQFMGGVFFILGGVLMLSAPYWVNKGFLYDYPVLLNAVFCIT